MSTRLNLASHPFRNRTLPWTVAIVVSLASLVALVFIAVQSSRMKDQAVMVERDVVAQRKELDKLEQKAAEIRQSLSPEQQKLHDAAHGLVGRKRFSWTRLFTDLEAAMPANVRVSRINVRDVGVRGGQTIADLELSVVSKNAADVTNMMSEMNRSGTFRADLISQNPSRGRGDGAEWVLSVRYTPRGATAAPESAEDRGGSVASATGATTARVNATNKREGSNE